MPVSARKVVGLVETPITLNQLEQDFQLGLYTQSSNFATKTDGTRVIVKLRNGRYRSYLVTDWVSSTDPVTLASAVFKANNVLAALPDLALEVKLASIGSLTLSQTAGLPVNITNATVPVSGPIGVNSLPTNTTGQAAPAAATPVAVGRDSGGLLVYLNLVAPSGVSAVQDLPVMLDIDAANNNLLGTGLKVVNGAQSLGVPTTSSFTGNATLTPGASILKSAFFSGVAAANKQLTLGGNLVSTKTGAASPADLLDREIAVPAATTLGLANGVAGDTVRVTYITLP